MMEENIDAGGWEMCEEVKQERRWVSRKGRKVEGG